MSFVFVTDVDNTLGDLTGYLRVKMDESFGNKNINTSNYIIGKEYGLSDSEFDSFLYDTAMKGEFQKSIPIKGAQFALQSVAGAGSLVIYVSSRARYFDTVERAKNDLTKWLVVNNFPKGHIYISNGAKNKIKIAHEGNAGVLVDDLEDNLTLASQENIRTIVFTRPWNVNYKHPNVVRMNAWHELPRIMSDEFGQFI